jgi:hypothetical protein
MKWKRLLEKFRKWLDDEAESVTPTEKRKASQWEEFYLTVARELDQVMQRELFRVPGGSTLVPREYLVFLKPDLNKEWQGEKRKALVNGLKSALWERAKELTGNAGMSEKSFTVKLRADATLQEAPFRVQHVWDPDEETIVAGNTAVRCFSLMVQQRSPETEAISPEVFPAYSNEITIGRGSTQEKPDLVLAGDREVSRKHATLVKLDDSKFKITCHGANPILLNGGQRIIKGESMVVTPGDNICICSYVLVIQ